MSYDFGAECFTESTEALLEMYLKEVLKQKSAILGTNEVENACKVAMRAFDRLLHGSG